VRAGQWKIRPLVIKSPVVQFHYLCPASFVFGVAITAGSIPYPAVITRFVFYVPGDVFMIMTTQTKLVLPATFKGLVTILALVFEFRVMLAKVTRRYHRVQRTHVRAQRRGKSQQNQSHPS